MFKKLSSSSLFIIIIFSFTIIPIFPRTIIFYEKGFPSYENGLISRGILERALSSLKPVFMDFRTLISDTSFREGDLLVLPYGSAFPQEAWETINKYISKGNLLVIGGRPLAIPVYFKNKKWIIENPQNTFSKTLGIQYSYEIPLEKNQHPESHENASFFKGVELNSCSGFC